MNRDRVIFVKDIDNNTAQYLSSTDFPNVVFFTSDKDNEQIWYNGTKCSGITRMHNTEHIMIYNYQYSAIEYIHNRTEKDDQLHSLYINNYKIVIDYGQYSPDIAEMVYGTSLNAYIEGDDIQSCKWRLDDNDIFSIIDPETDSTNITIKYNRDILVPCVIPIHCEVTSTENIKYDVYGNIIVVNGELVGYGETPISLSLSIPHTAISVDESMYINPIITISSLDHKSTLSTVYIKKIEWEVSNENICKISNDGVITGIYSSELNNNQHYSNVTITCNITLSSQEGKYEYNITKNCTIRVYEKYKCDYSFLYDDHSDENPYIDDPVVRPDDGQGNVPGDDIIPPDEGPGDDADTYDVFDPSMIENSRLNIGPSMKFTRAVPSGTTLVGDDSQIVIDDPDATYLNSCSFEGTFANSEISLKNIGFVDDLREVPYTWNFTDNRGVQTNLYYGDYGNNNLSRKDELRKLLDNSYNIDLYWNTNSYVKLDNTIYTRRLRINQASNLKIHGDENSYSKTQLGFYLYNTYNVEISYMSFIGYHGVHEFPTIISNNLSGRYTSEGTVAAYLMNPDVYDDQRSKEKCISYRNTYPWKGFIDLFGDPFTLDAKYCGSNSEHSLIESFGLEDVAVHIYNTPYGNDNADTETAYTHIHNCHVEMRQGGLSMGVKKEHCNIYYTTVNDCTFEHLYYQPVGSHGSYFLAYNIDANYTLQGIDFSTGANNSLVRDSKFTNCVIGPKTDGVDGNQRLNYNNHWDNIEYQTSNKLYTDIVQGNTDPLKSGILYLETSQYIFQNQGNALGARFNTTNSTFNHDLAYISRDYNLGVNCRAYDMFIENTTINIPWSWDFVESPIYTKELNAWLTNKAYHVGSYNIDMTLIHYNGKSGYIPMNYSFADGSLTAQKYYEDQTAIFNTVSQVEFDQNNMDYDTPRIILKNSYIYTSAYDYGIICAQSAKMHYVLDNSYVIGTNPHRINSQGGYDVARAFIYKNKNLSYEFINTYIPVFVPNNGWVGPGDRYMINTCTPPISTLTLNGYTNNSYVVNNVSYFVNDARVRINNEVITVDNNQYYHEYDPLHNDIVTIYYGGNSHMAWTEDECDTITVHTDIDGTTRWLYPTVLVCTPYTKNSSELAEYFIIYNDPDDDPDAGNIPLLRIPSDIMGNNYSSSMNARSFLTNNDNEKWNAIIDYYWNIVSNPNGAYTSRTKADLKSALEDKCYINDTSKTINISRGYFRYVFGMNEPDGASSAHGESILTGSNAIKECIHRRHPARKEHWQGIIDEYFKTGGVLDSFNTNIGKWKNIIGEPSFGKHSFILNIPMPCGPSHFICNDELYWGELNGESINFASDDYINKNYPLYIPNQDYKDAANTIAKQKAIAWYIDSIANEINNHNYENIDIIGLYIVEETTSWNEDVMTYTANYIKSKGLKAVWLPYANDSAWVPGNYSAMDEHFNYKQYNIDVCCGQTGWTWKPAKTYQDFANVYNNYTHFDMGIMYEFQYKLLNSESDCESMLQRNIELWNMFKDDPTFLSTNNLSPLNITSSALIEWYYDAWFITQINNISNVYKFNLISHTNAEAEEFASTLHPWQYSTKNYVTGYTEAVPTAYNIVNGKIYLYYANKSTNNYITDAHMRQISELLDDIAMTVYNRNR